VKVQAPQLEGHAVQPCEITEGKKAIVLKRETKINVLFIFVTAQ
jgi:hypothetical protein